MTTRTVDSRGRLTLGPDYANQLVVIRASADGTLQIMPAKAIPVREAWLYQNEKALASVRRGLAQAEAGGFVEPPHLEAGGALADAIEE